MRIGFFTSIDGWGGSETYLRTLAGGLVKRGHEPVLFGIGGTRLSRELAHAGIRCVAWRESAAPSPQPSSASAQGCGETQPARGEGAEGEQSSGKRLEREPSPAPARRRMLSLLPLWLKLLAGNAREVRRLGALFRAHPVDVLQVNVHGYEVAGLAARLAGIPALAMNMITPPEEAYWFRRRLMVYTMRRYDRVSGQSAHTTAAWARLAGLRPEVCSHVWNGVDLDRFSPAARTERLPDQPLRLASVGRLHPMKGYRYLVEAVAAADARIDLDLYGEGPEEPALKARAAALGLGRRIRFRGHVEDPEARLREADAFVLPSVSHESCPAVLAEAMASGLPLVTSDFGPLPEINLRDVTGLVVPAGDPAALAAAFADLADHPAKAAAMARAGAERARACFSSDTMVDRMVNLYSELAALGRCTR